MSFLSRFRRKKEDPEVARRALLLRAGRLGEATVLGVDTDGEGNSMLGYSYTVGGVDYEAFQRQDADQLSRPNDYLPGTRAALRYDPHRPVNSFVI